MKHLDLYPTDTVDELVWPANDDVLTPKSSALKVFTDFTRIKPLVIEPSLTALQAQEIMKKTHVRLQIVVDEKNHFLGIISFDDISEQSIAQKVASGFNRDNLHVKDCMLSKREIKAFGYGELKTATIADVVEALKHAGQRHCLVIDREKHQIRGVVSASEIAKKLHIPLDVSGAGSSFIDVFRAVNH